MMMTVMIVIYVENPPTVCLLFGFCFLQSAPCALLRRLPVNLTHHTGRGKARGRQRLGESRGRRAPQEVSTFHISRPSPKRTRRRKKPLVRLVSSRLPGNYNKLRAITTAMLMHSYRRHLSSTGPDTLPCTRSPTCRQPLASGPRAAGGTLAPSSRTSCS